MQGAVKTALASIAIILFAALAASAQQQKLPSLDSEPGTAASDLNGKCAYSDGGTRAACNKAEQAKFAYRVAAYQNATSTFAWSLTANIIIFAVVIVLVLSGLVFAAIQFRIAFHHGMQVTQTTTTTIGAVAAGSETPLAGMATNMEIDSHGIKVSSSILGVIVLLISMAFFYLYAIYIYPIQVVHPENLKSQQGQEK